MRIWSIHPQYLDSKGLVAAWREGLLAQKVLQGKTKGYKNHSSLTRFKAYADPQQAIADYLWGLHDEAYRRMYSFDTSKIALYRASTAMEVTHGQIHYEWDHLMKKLYERDRKRYHEQNHIDVVQSHPMFIITEGPVEFWEKV